MKELLGNEKAKRIYEVINEVVVMPDVQRGFPDANGNTNVTWCNRALHRILDRLGGQESLLLEPRGINWTNANAMVRNARANTERVSDGGLAQSMANDGSLIVAVAPNDKGPGHVALVCPDVMQYKEELGPRIGQAGLRNGIMYIREGFAHLTPLVEYYLIPYESGCSA
ncbi:MAG: hypothetical protein LBU88_00375 [Treponema sp.]|nr:hypothetical protein [Treponema sp.]